MLTAVLQLAGGLVLLLLGGRLLVSGAVDAARRLNVSPLLIGLTLVAWGTSAPEMALNLISAAKGRSDLAVGNVVGANICNMALVIGICALIRPLIVEERLVRIEVWLNAVALAALSALALIFEVDRWSAAILLGGFVVYSAWTIYGAQREARSGTAAKNTVTLPGSEDLATHERPPMSWALIILSFVVGLALLTGGGSLASDGATAIALALGIPAAIVGVTIVSIGTTLPELVTSIVAQRRGATDLAMGNVIGSCLFNTGAVFGLVGVIEPPVADGSLHISLIYMVMLGIALIPISRMGSRTISRIEGGGLLLSYLAFLSIAAVQSNRGG